MLQISAFDSACMDFQRKMYDPGRNRTALNAEYSQWVLKKKKDYLKAIAITMVMRDNKSLPGILKRQYFSFK